MSQAPYSASESENQKIEQAVDDSNLGGGIQGAMGNGNIQYQDNRQSIYIIQEKSKRSEDEQMLLQAVKKDVVFSLRNSLQNDVFINLRKEIRQEQVNFGKKFFHFLDSEAKILDIFRHEDIDGKLLILGNPGSGKTTTLQELARYLIKEAEQNSSEPIPILFNLSSWQAHEPSILDWLLSELNSRYGVELELGKQWLKKRKLLPMLDGLDEIELELQEDCVSALNEFMQTDYRSTYLVVCSCSEEYNSYTINLNLNAAICLHSLSETQIAQYFDQIHQRHLLNTIQSDTPLSDNNFLLEIIKIPSFLNIFVTDAIEKGSNFKNTKKKLKNLWSAYTKRIEIKNYQIECLLKNLKDPIQVNNSISLKLVDLNRFYNAIKDKVIPFNNSNEPDIDQWIKNKLEKQVSSILYKETFSDLLLEFEPTLSVKTATQPQRTTNGHKQLKHELKNNFHPTYYTKLLASLKIFSKSIGYKITLLTSEPKINIRDRLALDKFEFLEIEDYGISCYVKGFDRPILVKNILYLQLSNIGKYSIAVKNQEISLNHEDGKPDLEKWVKQKLQQIIKPLLIQKDYIELILGTGCEQYNQEVFTQIQLAATEIGYEVKQIISIPEVQKIREFKENFSIETDAQQYHLKDVNFCVKLQAKIVMRIEDLQAISDLLRRSEINLQQQIITRMYETISYVLNRIDPERFYMGFTTPDAKRRGETKSVELELGEAIEQEIKERFKATVINSIFYVIDTDIIELLKSLQNKNSEFKVEFEPRNGKLEKITFIGRFCVLSVADNCWNKFTNKFIHVLDKRKMLKSLINTIQKARYDAEKLDFCDQDEIAEINQRIEKLEAESCGIDLLRKTIEEDFLYILRKCEGDIFNHADIQELDVIKKTLNIWLQERKDSILDLYGLEIQVSQLSYSMQKSSHHVVDEQYTLIRLRRERTVKEQQIQVLEEKLIHLNQEFGTEIDIEEEIKKIESRLKSLYDDIQRLSFKITEEKQL